MKKKYLFLAAAYLLAALFLLGAFWILHAEREKKPGEYPKIYQQYVYNWFIEEDSVTGLDIDWLTGDVDLVIKEDGDSIVIREYAVKRLTEQQVLNLSEDGDNLKIKWNENLFNLQMFDQNKKNLVVEIPRSFAESMRELKCSTASGNIRFDKIAAENIHLACATGSVLGQEVRAETAYMRSVTGDIQLSQMVCGQLELFTVSGDVTANMLQAETAAIQTTSGRVLVDGSLNTEANIRSVTGEIQLRSALCPKTTVLRSVSGEIGLYLPPSAGEEGFDLQYFSVSGQLRSDFTYDNADGNENSSRGRSKIGKGVSALDIKTTTGLMGIYHSAG